MPLLLSTARGYLTLDTVLAIDLGGSSLKVCLFTAAGEILAEARTPLAFEQPRPGWSEQQPQVWWDALVQTVTRVLQLAGAARVQAIAICGFTRTQVFVDRHGQPTCPAIGFRDTRAADVARRAVTAAQLEQQSQAASLNAFHPLARVLWLRDNSEAAWTHTEWVLEAKDYLVFRLTGRITSDCISQHWLATTLRDGAPALGTRLGLNKTLVPPLLQPWDIVGSVRDDLPQALSALTHAVVLSGCNDTWTAVAGLGALRAGRAYCVSGSSEVVGVLSGQQAVADGLVTLPWGERLWHIGGPGQNGSNVLKWIVDCLSPGTQPFAERFAALWRLPEASRPLLFQPYLHGERTPFWDAELRGAFLGLEPRHGPRDMLRAVMESVAFVDRLVLERAEAATGTRAPQLLIAGGGARLNAWNQIRADVLGRPVVAKSARELGLAGCLAVARVGLGLNADMVAAADAVAQPAQCFVPDAERHTKLDRLFNLFKDSHDAIAGISHQLAALE